MAKLEVPLGIYRIKIASGDTWYGMDDLFGPGTRVQTAEKPLRFYAEGNPITGHTWHLQSVAGGNRFPTAEAARREFQRAGYPPVRWLAKFHADYPQQLQCMAEIRSLPTGPDSSPT